MQISEISVTYCMLPSGVLNTNNDDDDDDVTFMP